MHVEITVALGGGPPTWSLARGTADRVTHATGHDSVGELGVQVVGAVPGVELRLDRPSKGPVTLAYDVLAGGDAPDDPLGVLVLDDRFRGAGERLVALPLGADGDGSPKNTLLRIDGEALRAPGAASSVGVGPARRTTLHPGSLRLMSFVAGSLGVEVIDDPAAGHDEGAWLGYTAFDPRPTIAELAQMRSSLRELLRSQVDPGSWTYLFVAQTRPLGSFTTTPRARSMLVQVGPSEPWSAALRLSVAQQLARRWLGGELEVGSGPEGAWFDEGVCRYVAMLLLAHVGLFTPDEVREAVAGELSVVATSPHRALGNAQLAQLAAKDEVARATLMARGALYALRESATLRARTRGQRGLVDALVGLVSQAEGQKGHAPLSVAAWLDALAKDDPDAARTFDAVITRGEPLTLPADALGPCFRAGTGEYVAFDPGFDLDATRVSADGRVVGIRADGPAARAGLRDGDVVTSMQARDGDPSAPIKLVVERAGAKITLSYLPRGAHGRGQTWSRLRVADDRCGDPP